MNESVNNKVTRTFGAEWSKLISLPSTWFILLGTALINVILAAAFTSTSLKDARITQDILDIGLASMGYLQIGFIILGISATCSEYKGGQILTTLTTVPWRKLQLTIKHLVLTLLAIPAAILVTGLGVAYATFMLKDTVSVIEIDTIIKALVGATGYVALTTVLSAAVGALFRRTIPALIVLMSYYFIASPLLRVRLPNVANYLPDTAGYYMYVTPQPGEGTVLTSMQGTLILSLWVLIFILIAIFFYRKRDA